MNSWASFTTADPVLTSQAEAVLDARRLKCLATLRRDGSARLSETSGVRITDGDLWLAVIPSAKRRDLDRDDRVSVHCGSPGDEWAASLRLSGRALTADHSDISRFVASTGITPTDRFTLYRVELTEVVITRPHPDTGVILVEWWTPSGGSSSATRQPG